MTLIVPASVVMGSERFTLIPLWAPLGMKSFRVVSPSRKV
jgi:hypothetical protein